MSEAEIAQKQLLIDRGERLRIVRSMLRMTIVEFAALCECGESTIRQWEQGRASGFTRKGAVKVCRVLEITPVACDIDWLLEGSQSPPHFKQAKPPTKLSLPVHTADSSDEKSIKVEIEHFSQTAAEPLIMRVQDDAMEPFFLKGDYVAGNRIFGLKINQLVGQICIVQTVDGLILLRKIHSQHSEKYRLLALNPNAVSELIMIESELVCAAAITRLWRAAPIMF